jgi:7-cyano-7-deazaguanine synthase
MNSCAVILFSGGIDSTTALYWARKEFGGAVALIIDYSQKHRIEARMARKIAAMNGVDSHLLRLPLKGLLYSALLDDERPIPASLAHSQDERGVPFTYVPFRNGIFLALAAAFGESRGIFDLVTGFNRIDTPDYPDTTEAFTRKMEAAINEGTSARMTGRRFRVHTPLARLNKKEIISLGLDLGADYSRSISCYRGRVAPCRQCPACEIRIRAFDELGMEDPLVTRLERGKRR